MNSCFHRQHLDGRDPLLMVSQFMLCDCDTVPKFVQNIVC